MRMEGSGIGISFCLSVHAVTNASSGNPKIVFCLIYNAIRNTITGTEWKDSRPTATESRPLQTAVLSFEVYRGLFNMDPLQTAALNALAPYLALCASANSPAAAATCISQAISVPNTYIFAELLSKPNIQALRSADLQYARWLRVLEIFSWGTWLDYQCEHAF